MAEGTTGGSPSRTYKVFEQVEFEDDDRVYFVQVHEVTARNHHNAVRKAFRELRAQGFKATEAMLTVVPESYWRPTPVSATVREQVAVG